MTESLERETEGFHPSPENVARVLKGLRGMEAAPQAEPSAPEVGAEKAEPKAGDLIERDGVQYMLVPELRSAPRWQDGRLVYETVPYTYAQYYAHTFEEPGTGDRTPGPGWDSKFRLTDDNLAMLVHNRTFAPEELQQLPANLPNTDCLFVSDLEGGRVAEYQEYLEKQEQQNS